MTHCPEAEQLQRFLDGQLDDRARQAAERHVEACPRCQEELERLTASEAKGLPLPLLLWEGHGPGRAASRAAPSEVPLPGALGPSRPEGKVSEPPGEPRPPGRAGRYELCEEIARGG